MSKEAKKVKVFFDESAHYQEMNKAYEIAGVFKAAKNELESIISKPIEDFTAFRSDVLNYSLAEIKKVYPGAFNLNLPLDKTLQMLSIDLRKIENYDAILATTPHSINVCCETGEATPNDDKEPFCWYAETPEQHERLNFANELSDILERSHKFMPHVHKANMTTGLERLVYFNMQNERIQPHHYFVMNGIQ